jgi:hypothetical protein
MDSAGLQSFGHAATVGGSKVLAHLSLSGTVSHYH